MYYVILLALGGRFSLYLLYWYESANTDAASFCWRSAAGAQFTCFTGAKVQILTQKALLAGLHCDDAFDSAPRLRPAVRRAHMPVHAGESMGKKLYNIK